MRDSQMLVAHVGNEGAVGRDGRVVKKKEARTMKEAAAQREAQLEAVRRTAKRGAGSPPRAQLAVQRYAALETLASALETLGMAEAVANRPKKAKQTMASALVIRRKADAAWTPDVGGK